MHYAAAYSRVCYSTDGELLPTHYTVYSVSRGRGWTEEPRRKRDRSPLQLHEALDLADTLQGNAEARGGGNGHRSWVAAVFPDGSRRLWPLSHSPENATYLLDNRGNESTVTPYFDRPLLTGRRVNLDADHTTLDGYGKTSPQFAKDRLLTKLHQLTGYRSGLADSAKRRGLGYDSDFWKQMRSLREEGLRSQDWTPWLAMADLIDEHDVNPYLSKTIREHIDDFQNGDHGYVSRPGV